LKELIRKLLRLLVEQLSNTTIRRIYQYFLGERTDEWTKLSRESLHTVKEKRFLRDLYRERFYPNDIIEAFRKEKTNYPNATFYLAHDSKKDLLFNDIKNIDHEKPITDKEIKDTQEKVFLCAFTSDESLTDFLIKIKSLNNYIYIPIGGSYPTARYFDRNNLAKRILQEESELDLDKFELSDYENIVQAIDITKNNHGPFVEIGVYKGRSAHLALNYMKQANISKKAFLIDTYEGFNYSEAAASPDRKWDGTHGDTSIEYVTELLKEFDNKELLKMNVISDDLPPEINNVSVCNIDVDIYEAVLVATIKMAPRMALGGVIILEDQGHTPALAGAYLALREFMESAEGDKFTPIHFPTGQAFLVKTFN
jgi:hypothetical protein